MKKYNAGGLAEEGAAALVDMEEYACLGSVRYPWSKEFKAKVVQALDGANSQLEINERINRLADEEFKSVEGRC